MHDPATTPMMKPEGIEIPATTAEDTNQIRNTED